MSANTTKAVWQSKTIWFNFAVIVLAAIELQLSVLRPVMPSNGYVWTAIGLAMANAGLRFLTTQPISWLGGVPDTQGAGTPWWHDPVLWFNFLAAVLAAAEAKLGLIAGTVPPEAQAYVAFFLALANVVLRFWVTQAVTLRQQQAPQA